MLAITILAPLKLLKQAEPPGIVAMAQKVTEGDVLLVIDLQSDFIPGGSLAVPVGDEVVPLVNQLSVRFQNVVLTQDWHPPGHASFASANPGRQPFEIVSYPYGPQVLWLDHCTQGTGGAQFQPGLQIAHSELIIRKGYRRAINSYSAYYENNHATPTGLSGYLRERGLRRVFLAGRAPDFCVRYSAEDGRRCSFEMVVIEEATRGIDLNGSVGAARRVFAELAISIVSVDSVV